MKNKECDVVDVNNIKGRVRGIEEYGAFVDLPDGTSGLLHISEIDHKRVERVEDYFSVGDVINVVVKEIKDGGKISLTRKPLIEKQISPWQKKDFDKKYRVGSVVDGVSPKVFLKGNVIVVLNDGLEASIPNSAMPGHILDKEKFFDKNNVRCVITSINKKRERMSLEVIIDGVSDDNLIALEYNSENNCLYIDYKTNLDNLKKDLSGIKKNNVDFFSMREDISSLGGEEQVNYYFKSFFNEGIPAKTYFSNTSLKEKELKLTVRLDVEERPVLKKQLPENSTMLFRGYLDEGLSNEPIFVLQQIVLSSDYSKKKYEVERDTVVYYSEEYVYPKSDGYGSADKREYSILEQSFIDAIPMASQIAKRKLKDWEGYLNWAQEYSENNLLGYRFLYRHIENDKLVFFVIVNGKNQLKELNRNINRHKLEVYDLSYSENEYSFIYNKNNKYNKKIKLGEFDKKKEFTENKEKSKKDAGATFFELYNKQIKESKFKNPILVKAVYHLSDEDKGKLDYIEEKSKKEDFLNKVVARYPERGFLATNAVGDFAQIGRQKKALNDVISGNTYAPYLSSWLFDIDNAELPFNEEEGFDFLNDNLNESQREAVVKMLNVPNIGLIQGPPGTGKTTVIAEIMYQLAKQGKKTLLASQSHLAVDNALERLGSTPDIRAIRLGKADKISEDGQQFTEENILNSFYQNIASSCENAHLSDLSTLKKHKKFISDTKKELGVLHKKNENYRSQIENKQSEYSSLQHKLSNETEELSNLKINNEKNGKIKKELLSFIEFLNGQEKKAFFIADNDVQEKVNASLTGTLYTLQNIGIRIYSDVLKQQDYSIGKWNEILKSNLEISKKVLNNEFIDNLKSDLRSVNGLEKNTNQYEIDKLKNEFDIIEENLDEVDEDSEAFSDLWKKRKELKKQIKKNNNSSILSNKEYKNVFDEDKFKYLLQLESTRKDEFEKVLIHIISSLTELNKENFFKNIQKEIEKLKGSISIEEVDEKEVKRLTALIENLKSDLNETNESLFLVNGKLHKVFTGFEKEFDHSFKNIGNLELCLNEIGNFSDAIDYRLKHSLSNEMTDLLGKWVNKLKDGKTLDNDKDFILDRYLENSNAIGITINENPKTIEGKGFNNFDVAIIDEVSKATPPELLFAMSIAKKVILVGDHRQLPPVFSFYEDNSDEKSVEEIVRDKEESKEKSLLSKDSFKKYKKMVTASLFKEYFEKSDDKLKQPLLIQYRMHTQIMDVINSFYEGKLIQGLSNPDKDRAHNLTVKSPNGLEIITPDKHALWIDSSRDENGKLAYEKQEGTSKSNELEVSIIIELIEKLNKELISQGYNSLKRKDVGVISFYGRQVKLLKSRISKNKYQALKIEINSVDKFQGKEKPVIIVSMVRNKKMQKQHKKIQQGKDVAYVAQYERINVAFSRAQELLLVVGAKDMFHDYEVELPAMDREGTIIKKVYSDIIRNIDHQGNFLETKDIISTTATK